MSRKCKVGIDYFSHDVDMLQDKKIKLVKAKHGLIGYAIYLRLLEEIYREKGYYIKADDDFNFLFADDNNIDINDYILILNDCIEKALFESVLYEKYRVLTSQRIQKNYCNATERRKEVDFIREYLLIDVNSQYKKDINVNIITLDADIKEENTNKSTQSKVKESKVKNTLCENDFFDKIWELYPKKKGKGKVSPKKKKELHKIGYETLKKCIERYIAENKNTEEQYLQYGSTFFNSGYVDYLDENYKQQKKEQQEQSQYRDLTDYEP